MPIRQSTSDSSPYAVAMPPSTNSALALARDAEKVSQLDLEQPDLRFVTPQVASTSLPYKDPKDVKIWTRRNGNLVLTVTPGTIPDENDEARELGLPYGTIPRMGIAWMCREAVRTQNPELELPKSLAEFMRALGINGVTGGKKGSIQRVRNQFERLRHCHLILQQQGHPDLDHGLQLGIASAWKMWWSTKDAPSRTFIRLTDEFFRLAVSSPVPISMHALRRFQQYPVQIDLYCWLTYRFSYLTKPTHVTWEELIEQFGFQLAPGPQGMHQFKKAIIDNLVKVKAIYYQANVEVTKKGLLLKPSQPHVAFKGTAQLRLL